MIIILFLAVYRVVAFSVRFHMEPWSKPVTMKNLFLQIGRDRTLAFHMEPLGSIWNSIRTICRESVTRNREHNGDITGRGRYEQRSWHVVGWRVGAACIASCCCSRPSAVVRRQLRWVSPIARCVCLSVSRTDTRVRLSLILRQVIRRNRRLTLLRAVEVNKLTHAVVVAFQFAGVVQVPRW